MQTSYSSSRILLPVRPWFIGFSLLVALLLNFLPTAVWPGVPDWLALVIVFWSVREPRRVGMGLAFLFGVAMDVADASLLGQHALAYVLVAYGGSSLSRRILWFPLGQQALQVFAAALAGAVGAVQRAHAGRRRFPRALLFHRAMFRPPCCGPC
jgi:rod shape-determining protein MreD